jgi:hypothetical protein
MCEGCKTDSEKSQEFDSSHNIDNFDRYGEGSLTKSYLYSDGQEILCPVQNPGTEPSRDLGESTPRLLY